MFLILLLVVSCLLFDQVFPHAEHDKAQSGQERVKAQLDEYHDEVFLEISGELAVDFPDGVSSKSMRTDGV